MKNIILFDDDKRRSLLPLVYNRPVGELKLGILSIREKWERHLKGEVSYITQDYLTGSFPIKIQADNYVINARALPTPELIKSIEKLDYNEAMLQGEHLLAVRLNEENFRSLIDDKDFEELNGFQLEDHSVRLIEQLSHLYFYNGLEIEYDYELITKDRDSQEINENNTVIGDGDIFIEEGAEVNASTLNTSEGPIYIGKNATVQEGCHLRGPLALCDNGSIKMGARIFPETTIGIHSKAGGEINNSIIMDYSNKGHDGFLGNSVIGSWCNIGADTNTSNLKNNYSDVKQWTYDSHRYESTGAQFCGLVMGDHSKCGINTMFNTGTVVGICANIFGGGFPPKFIPSFSWGGRDTGWETHDFEKAIITAQKMMERRDKALDEEMLKVLAYIYERTRSLRNGGQ